MLKVKFAPLATTDEGTIQGHGSATIGQGTAAEEKWYPEHDHNHYLIFNEYVCPWELGEPKPNEEESITTFSEIVPETIPEIVDGE